MFLSFPEPALAAAREMAVRVFADWETRLKAGDTVVPGPTLQRLLLTEGNGTYPLKVDQPGTRNLSGIELQPREIGQRSKMNQPGVRNLSGIEFQ